ncbi:FecR family protein [Sphingobacterium sp.]|uniref:FecR family protein n=1 Tax=Sphingobacterium sp. TaxID=341027 RepID=UPI00289C92AF|nr:FecR family protein [Sphingobacterium sp.]
MTPSNDNRLRYLLDLCLSGQESKAERDELDGYLSDKNVLENLDAVLLDLFFQQKELIDMPSQRQHQILEAIYAVDTKIPSVKRFNYLKWTAAAAIFLGILFSTIWLGTQKQLFKDLNVVNKKEQIDNNPSGKGKASRDDMLANKNTILQMGNGSRLALESLDSGKVIEKDGVHLQRTSDGTLLIQLKPGIEQERNYANNINTITTPRGRTYRIMLGDGTVVHLNAESRLSFPTTFGKDERRVTFEGEGYFEVAKDKTRRFFVNTNVGNRKQEISVYGTQFNISAYNDADAIKTTLIEGSVRIRSVNTGHEILMKPNELVVINHTGLTKQPADLESSLAWKNNYFYFADLPIQEVLQQISRWYDVDINYQGKIPGERVWGQISRTKKLKEVLEILEKANHIKFQQKGKEVIVMR